jgi:Pyruvate/2-oxoacid:ferredoxin oxidoreductase delta subunit
VAADIVAVRAHLVRQHNIDLENPSASLVEPEATSTTFGSELTISRHASPVTITDAGVDLITSSSSPDRTSPVLGPVKIELIEDPAGEQEHAKDLSIRGQQQQRQQPEVVHVNRKRAPSPVSITLVHKAAKLTQSGQSKSPDAAGEASDAHWQCQHCTITFPNQTLYFLHRGFHSETDPWRCNGCGLRCTDLYDFNTHLVSDPHR